jgi:glycosyltransferase involved in cell wall biosynthesis
MKLLVISPMPPSPNAEADHTFHLCRRLADAGVEIDVATTTASAGRRFEGLRLHPVLPDWTWAAVPAVLRVVRRARSDVVLVSYSSSSHNFHPMVTFLPTLVRRVRPRPAVVTLVHNTDGWRHGNVSVAGRAIRKLLATLTAADYDLGTLARDSDGLLAVSEPFLAELVARCPDVAGRGAVLPAPPALPMAPAGRDAAVRARLGAGPGDFLLIFFGYVYRGKGIDTLIEAFHEAAMPRPRLRLALVGGTFDTPGNHAHAAQLRARAAALGLQARIVWTGAYAADSLEPSRFLRQADAGVLPFDLGVSLRNTSFAALAAHDLPVVTTRGRELEPAFVDGDNVLLCPPRDPAAMAAVLGRVVDDDGLRERLRAGARRLAADVLSWDRATAIVLSMLRRAIVARR